MSYRTGKFNARDPARRVLRDQYRDKFFADLGLSPDRDPLSHEPDTKAQLSKVSDLSRIAAELHDDDTSALDAMTAEVSSLGLGHPNGIKVAGKPIFGALSPSRFASKFFWNAWGNRSGDDE